MPTRSVRAAVAFRGPPFGEFGLVKMNYSNLTVAQIEWVSIGGYPYAGRQPIRRAQHEDDGCFRPEAATQPNRKAMS